MFRPLTLNPGSTGSNERLSSFLQSIQNDRLSGSWDALSASKSSACSKSTSPHLATGRVNEKVISIDIPMDNSHTCRFIASSLGGMQGDFPPRSRTINIAASCNMSRNTFVLQTMHTMIGSLGKLYRQYFRASRPIDEHDDDETYPLHFVDNRKPIRQFISNYTFQYDVVLNPEKLCESLVQLLSIGDWRKLGGRLRLKHNGDLEIKVPQKYTKDRPAIRFSRINSDLEINQHPVARQLPQKNSDHPSVQQDYHTFECLSMPADLPNTIQHYLTTDEPMICLHITTFTNATLVCLTFPHALSDAMGTASLLRAWSAVLANQPDQIPPLLGAREDLLDRVGTPSDEKAQTPFCLDDIQLKGLSLLSFIIRYVWDLFTRRNIQARSIFLPAKFIAHLRQVAQEDAELESKKTPPFLSDGDLITAWGSHMILSSCPNKSAMIYNAFDVRHRLHGVFSPPGTASYLQNLIFITTAHLPSTGSATAPYSIGHIARKLRQAIVEQTTDTQTRSLLRVARQSYASTGLQPVFGSSDSTVIVCTNWSKAEFFRAIDFGPAVVTDSPSPSSNSAGGELGIPVSYWGFAPGTSHKLRNYFKIYGKDGEGNYWGLCHLRPETWDRIEEDFARYVHL